ncbi:MAG: flagellar hook-length control protein [Myxococcales bacterium]
MTWAKAKQDEQLKTVMVTCHGQPKTEGGSCNAYDGDTLCTERRPILCFKPDGSPRPPYAVTPNREYYEGWAPGRVGVTQPVAGNSLQNLAAANAACEQALGKGYRMAEFHDGKLVAGMDAQNWYGATWPQGGQASGGWAFHAHGTVPSDTRFWISINDQRAHCWDQ